MTLPLSISKCHLFICLFLTAISPRNQEYSRKQRRQKCLLYGSFLLANEMAEKTERMYTYEVLSGRRKLEWNERG